MFQKYFKYRSSTLYSLAGVLISLFIFMVPLGASGKSMPEFTITSSDQWVNSSPLKKSDLKGKVVLIEVWTSI